MTEDPRIIELTIRHYQELLKLPAVERLARLQDPAVRATILNDEPSAELVRRLSQFRQQITTRWDRMFVMGDPPDYEPEASSSIAAMAQRSNHSPSEVAYDYLAGGLDKAAREALVEHLEGCANCRTEVAELNAVWRGLEAVKTGMESAPDEGARANRAGRVVSWIPAFAGMTARFIILTAD